MIDLEGLVVRVAELEKERDYWREAAMPKWDAVASEQNAWAQVAVLEEALELALAPRRGISVPAEPGEVTAYNEWQAGLVRAHAVLANCERRV